MPHTPGPWIVRRFGRHVHVTDSIPDAGGRFVANIIASSPSNPANEANAPILAASLDFLEAVTGDPEPALWRIEYAELVLAAMADGTADDAEAEDPQAWYEAVAEARRMCRSLRNAIARTRETIP